MKLILIAAGVLIGLVALVAICGALLPQQHVASRQARYRQPPENVWTAIASYKGDPRLEYKTEASEPPRRLVTRVIDPHHNFGGTWTCEIQPADGGSILRITESGEVYNPVFRFISRFVIGHTRTIDAALESFGAQFNESVRIED